MMSASFTEDDSTVSPAKQASVSIPKIEKEAGDSSDHEESEVISSDQLIDTIEEFPIALSDCKPPVTEKSKDEAQPDILTDGIESLSIVDKSSASESFTSEDRGRPSKPKAGTPIKSRSRARSIADVFESPYNTRLKAKLMKEKEQRSLSEDSGKRDAGQT